MLRARAKVTPMSDQIHLTVPVVHALSGAILEYWFSSLNDASPLDPENEPFSSCYARWYGKQNAIDEEIRTRFELPLRATTRDGSRWEEELERWRSAPYGLLALLILLDQLPRNMYRNSPAMYAHDPLALSVATLAIREYEDAPLSLVQRMFLYVPLMHAENLTIQQLMVRRFESLLDLAEERSPHNRRFFEYALRYARLHLEVIERFGRFPHRNEILGRRSSDEEIEFLKREDARF